MTDFESLSEDLKMVCNQIGGNTFREDFEDTYEAIGCKTENGNIKMWKQESGSIRRTGAEVQNKEDEASSNLYGGIRNPQEVNKDEDTVVVNNGERQGKVWLEGE